MTKRAIQYVYASSWKLLLTKLRFVASEITDSPSWGSQGESFQRLVWGVKTNAAFATNRLRQFWCYRSLLLVSSKDTTTSSRLERR